VKPKLLDLFCCAGGASIGYARAGYDVVGVDIARQRNYPFEFVQADAVQYLSDLLTTGNIEQFNAVHASPPCQAYTIGNAASATARAKWPMLIEPVQSLMQHIPASIPAVIENVANARKYFNLDTTVELCGCMFDLHTQDTDGITIHLQRVRLFEPHNFTFEAPKPHDHSTHDWVAGAYGGARRDKYEAKYVRKGGYVPKDKAVVKRLLGLPSDSTMSWNNLYESIPPAYAEYVGKQMLRHSVAV
jgi:DNA (cytosine-5)-methyltransferase 1